MVKLQIWAHPLVPRGRAVAASPRFAPGFPLPSLARLTHSVKNNSAIYGGEIKTTIHPALAMTELVRY
jgi:hypothetical protein